VTREQDKDAAYWKAYYEGHKAQRLATQTKYYRGHADARKTYEREYNVMKREHRRAYHFRKRYAVTLDQLEEMDAAQGGRCAICGEPPPKKRPDGRNGLCLDHDHVTGEVRELLCPACNGGLGLFRDNPVLLKAAVDYILRHGALALRRKAEAE
jgi:hypothetical protein